MATLQSVLDQDCGDWELIIKDGGSSESTLAAIPQDPRVRIIRLSDRGVFDAMNQSLEHVRGDWICFLNAGDFFPRRKALAMIVDYVKRDEAIEFLYTDVAKPSSRSGFERYPDQLRRAYLFSHMICHQAWFVRSRYYHAGHRYETRETSGSDRRFLLRMVLRDQVQHAHVPHALVSYKGGGVSQNPEVILRANLWVEELLKEIYTPAEYAAYRRFESRKLLAKRLLYDSGAWRVVRLLRKLQMRVIG